MKTKNGFTLLLTITILLASCAGFAQKVNLEGTSWVLIRIANQSTILGTAPTLVFKDGQVGGNASCNRFGGDIRLSGDRIEIRDLFWTLMACMDSEGIMQQEQTYMQMLGDARNFDIRDGQLVITTVNGDVLVFDPEN